MSQQRVTYKDSSKANWNATANENGWPGIEVVQTGCLMRIADATELMAKNYLNLQSEMEKYKRWYYSERSYNARLQRSNNALRGYIKRLKKM